MPTEQLRTELEAATERAREDPDLTVLEVTEPPGTVTFTLTERPLSEAVSLASDLGAAELYLFTEETGDGDLGRAGVAFVHEGNVHAMYRETTSWNVERALPVVDDPSEAADVASAGERVRVRSDDRADRQASTANSSDATTREDVKTDDEALADESLTNGEDPGADDEAAADGDLTTDDDAIASETAPNDETATDDQQKRQLADELLSEYGEQLSEGDNWQLHNRLESLSVPQLLDMREAAERQARLDPAEEERLARIVFRDGRFNREYDPEDTELLLNALDIDYDADAVRIDHVHRTAMNLRTVDE